MNEYESLLNEGYFVQKRVAEAEARGKALAEACVLHEVLMIVIELRFPSLLEEAQQKVEHIENPEVFRLLVRGLKRAPNEEVARVLLDLLAV